MLLEMTKDKIAEILTDIATLLDLKGENPFKSRAYINAARAIETAAEPLEKIFAADSTLRLKGVGDSIHEKISEMLQTGKLAYYEELKNSVPPGLVALLNIPGLGPKKVKALNDKLGVESVEQLEKACLEGKVAKLDGFGEKTQAKICEGINFRRQYASRHLLSDALLAAELILENLRAHPNVTRCSTAGSLRRFKEIIGDIDFLVSSKNPAAVIDFFTQQSGIINVSAAIQRGLRLNEYGLFQSGVETRDPQLLVPCSTEEEIFQKLGLAYVPPELREDAGEFASAEKGPLPRLLEWTQLKGSLHNHSNLSDGRDSLEEIARCMHDLGCSYWAITDHSKSSVQAHGLQPARLREQLREIQALNRKLAAEGDGFELLTGSEVDILAGGQLDFDDDLLAELDVVVASVHQGFTQSEAETTKRLITAAENPFVHMLGHLTGRLLLEREPYKVNQNAVIEACAATGTWIELNANPLRFDLDWRLWHQAREKGVKCVINCDAHRLEHAQFLRLGAGIARKGWLEAKDVINTLPLDKLKKELQRKRAR